MNYTQELIDFINSSPTAFHAVDTIERMLSLAGYTRIGEGDTARFSDGGKHYVVRNGSSIIAFRGKGDGFVIAASHCDTPAFAVKSSTSQKPYSKLTIEKYGGAIHYSWFDRPLSVAGRAVIRTEKGVECRLFNIDRDFATIPSVAIHLNRGVNDGYKFNPAVDLLPLVGLDPDADIYSIIAEELCVDRDEISCADAFLYNREQGRVVGANGELLLAPRIDDLACAYASTRAFLDAEQSGAVAVLAVIDNEEAGSLTKQGADSTFLSDTLHKIASEESVYYRMLENSFMSSADNAHAKHPNHPELSDSAYECVLGGGAVIKFNANQRYATDALSASIFNLAAKRVGAKTQIFHSRADALCGTTLGPIVSRTVPIPTADVGIPQLAMHSATETVAVSDIGNMVAILKELYSSSICKTDRGLDLIR